MSRWAWFAAGLGYGLLAGVIAANALDEMDRRAGYQKPHLAAPSIKVAPLDGAAIEKALMKHARATGRKLA